jgi:hypothetical protein
MLTISVLQTPQGEPLALRPDGTGTLTSHITSLLQALPSAHCLKEKTFLPIAG